MSDLLALIDGLNDGGAKEIVIYDEHYYGRNIDIDMLPENVTAICGKPPYKKDWAGGLDDSFSGLILLGFHSKRNTGELLHHSYEPDIKDLILNDMSVGEIGIETAIAGDFGVSLLVREDFASAINATGSWLKRIHLGNCVLKDKSHPRYGDTHPPTGYPGGEIDIPKMTEILRLLLDVGFLDKKNRGNLMIEMTPWPGKTVEETIADGFDRLEKAWHLV